MRSPSSKKDMPNFFIEAMTISGGQGPHRGQGDRRPAGKPRARSGGQAVGRDLPARREGQGAAQAHRLAAASRSSARRWSRSTTRRVEYISGGSNVQKIKEFFWKWRRSHSSARRKRRSSGISPTWRRPSSTWMQNLGIFGESVVEELAIELAEGARSQRSAVRSVRVRQRRFWRARHRHSSAMAEGGRSADALPPMAPQRQRSPTAMRQSSRVAAPAAELGAADRPHQLRRHGLVGWRRSRPTKTAWPKSRSTCPRT